MAHGTWIPKAVLERSDLPVTAKMLYGLVDALSQDEGCFASNEWVAATLGLKKRQVQNLIKRLIEAGLIVREDGDRRVLWTVEKQALNRCNKGAVKCTPPVQSVAPPPCNPLHPDRIEDNKEDKTPQPPWGERMAQAWKDWLDFRKQKKAKLTPLTVTKQFEMLASLSCEDEAVECIQQSIRNGWQGLFPPRQVMMPRKTLKPEDHNNGF